MRSRLQKQVEKRQGAGIVQEDAASRLCKKVAQFCAPFLQPLLHTPERNPAPYLMQATPWGTSSTTRDQWKGGIGVGSFIPL